MNQRKANLSGAVDWSWPVRLIGGGIFGAIVMVAATAIKVVLAIPSLFGQPWDLGELLTLPLYAITIGFIAGSVAGLILPLSRFGKIGDGIIGIVAGNAFMLTCALLFGGLEAITNLNSGLLIAILVSTLVGGFLGVECGIEFRKENELEEENDIGKL